VDEKENMKRYIENPVLLTTKIVSLNSFLQGVSADTNLTFRYADVGDEVTYEARGRGKNKFAKVESISRANEYNPPCQHFADCGGCSGQHISYERQFAVKTKSIVEKFQLDHEFTPELVPSQEHYHYRNRMDFAVFSGFIGLRQAENFRRIIDVKKCELQSEWANHEFSLIRDLIFERFSDLPFDRRTETGFLKYITLRTSLDSSDTMTIFTFIEEFESSEIEKKFIAEVLSVSTAKNIILCYNRRKSEVSADGKISIVKGNSFYKEDFFQKEILVPFNSFFQPNPKGFMPIIRFIDKVLESVTASTLVDLFCGNGFFSILFGEKFQHLIGYDWVESSIQTANENLTRIYPQKKVNFEKKDLLQIKDVFSVQGAIPDDAILILDPPRNGIGIKLSEYILQSRISTILYVSCNPHSQLEDLKILSQNYQIISGLITDPYPHTPHLESVLLLKKMELEPTPV